MKRRNDGEAAVKRDVSLLAGKEEGNSIKAA